MDVAPEIQIAPIDWVVLAVYLVAIAAIGVIAGLKVKDTEQYFLGNRRFGKWLMIGQSFGTGTHAEMPVSLAGAVYHIGVSAIWYQWKNLFATPFYWLHGAAVPAHPAHHHGRGDRGPLRPLDGRDLHRLRAELLHHQLRPAC